MILKVFLVCLKTTKKLGGGKEGIRTLDTLFTYTRFPGVRLQPLIHLSIEVMGRDYNEIGTC